MNKKHNNVYSTISKFLFIILGAALYSTGLEVFLIPNNIIDGGVVGISIMTSHFTKIPLGFLTFVLNIPFLIVGYKQIGKSFTLLTLFSVICYSLGISILRPIPGITQDILLASVFGGITIGLGIGLIIRNGGSTDGIEIVSIILDKKISFSLGQIVLFFNFFILVTAGLIFGLDRGMYSLIAYFIAIKIIDMVVEGLDESKAVIIISQKHQELSDALMLNLGRGVTLLNGQGGYKGDSVNVIYIIVSRLEISKLKSIVYDFDKDAIMTIGSVETAGKNYRKNLSH
ncbi:YitT family protein [Clostridium sp. JN-1]|uniref:YitT family protein n=1 Tax=Clostridium sp. JN-1 TaxID=2483110 RepID=UPI000F0B6928|nr:YitT family protein [Clostridium sp. JN-1]